MQRSSTPAAAGSSTGSPASSDTVVISPAAQREAMETGRIALNVQAGNLTSDQATQLYQQVATIHSQIAADKQANGGALSATDAQAINQLQSQLSATIYSDAHNGTAPPSDVTPTQAGLREAMQAGRIALNEQAGNLTSSQVQQLGAQQAQIDQLIASDQQQNSGPLTPQQQATISQMQDQASQAIYQAAHSSGS
ncbi:MAG: hypothetical protein U0Q18_21900 [Bryobacteraceae bacterium]